MQEEGAATGEKTKKKGRVCVTGGTGFVASWLIKKLLLHGYSVNTTVRAHPPDRKKDVSFLTSLPHAQDNLHIFTADLNDPESFKPAIQGCVGLFHVAHPMDLVGAEAVETIVDRSIQGTLGILQACIDSGTVKRVVYTSSAAALVGNSKDKSGDDVAVLDEASWSDVDFVKSLSYTGVGYSISKTMTERAVLEFAEKKGLEAVTVIPTWIHGPFVCPNLPGSVHSSLGLILGNNTGIKYRKLTPFVHTDDVAEAHIYLFEYGEAKGRYICSAVEATIEELVELISSRYPEYKLVNTESVSDPAAEMKGISSKKLLESGFRYKYGLQEMFDGAIECCKHKGFL